MSQTPFTPGKYRMANGEQAIVVCDVGENPIGPDDPYPLKGFASHGAALWTRDGKFTYGGADHNQDLKEPWTDPPTAMELCEMVVAYRESNPHAGRRLVAIAELAKARIAAEKARTA